jgi:S1-C subfamily serine protease
VPGEIEKAILCPIQYKGLIMEDILIIDAVERYLRDEMSKEEKIFFEELRKNNPEVDQLVVEHSMFLSQISSYGEKKDFRQQLNTVHNELVETGWIKQSEQPAGKIVRFWRKYKRSASIAATVAGVTAVVLSGLLTYFTPVPKKDLQELNRQVAILKKNDRVQSNEIGKLKSKVPLDARAANGGSGFLIDAKGYLVTNAHVVRGSSTIIILNNKGQEFKAKIAFLDQEKDLAILKIDDEDFIPSSTLPYSIRKTNSDLGEQIFTLGFPKDEIVYNEGYLSSKNGYNGDTISCQIAVSANPGNSGGPVLNRNGEVIGVLSTAQQSAQGVVFAIKSKNIYQSLEELKKDTTYQSIKLPITSNIRGLDRKQQIKHVEDCVFMVRGFTK